MTPVRRGAGKALLSPRDYERIYESVRKGFQVSMVFRHHNDGINSGVVCGILLEKSHKRAGWYLPLKPRDIFPLQMDAWERLIDPLPPKGKKVKK
jgi:hypothetical protein